MKENKYAISVSKLKKVFKREIKQSWFKNRVKAMFHPEFFEFEAVSEISFNVEQWEKVAFLWPNWAWKSTTIKMLSWMLHPTSWDINVLWFDSGSEREKLVYHIWAVFWQTSRLWYHLTPIDSFKLFWKLYSVPDIKLEERLNYLVNKFWIWELLNIPVRKLSLWQRMRCEVVASLINSPKLLLLDEPTIWLDLIAKQNLREIINEINKDEGTTIFLTSHDLWDVENICKRIIIINHWKILYDWNIKELRRTYVRTKKIRVKFESSDTPFKPLPFMKINKIKDTFVEFEIPNSKDNLSKTFELLTHDYEVEDITIEDPDIEEIIKEFY